jgi:sporulation protein YlmC with PRC-barrel domain
MSADGAEVPAANDAVLTPFSMLVGAIVTGPNGKAVGTIADVMMAAAEGKIVYVALSVGGVIGIGERLFAVPWGAFIVDPVGGALSLRFDAAALDGRPGFDKDNWPSAADAGFVTP